MCKERGAIFVNLYDSIFDNQGKLDAKYTHYGLHLTGEGYKRWNEVIINNLYK
jgi:lysophospholipase L1-like esterase